MFGSTVAARRASKHVSILSTDGRKREIGECRSEPDPCRKLGRGARLLGASAYRAFAHYFCSRNFEVRASVTPNDTYYDLLWGLEQASDVDIDAAGAWELETGTSSTIVAVLDTGVAYTHDDLRSNMWINPGEIAGNGQDDDGNGYVDDVYGISAISGEAAGNPMDDDGHGTHVAGTIGARGNNSLGVTGVSWNVKIMAVRFINATGSGLVGDAIEGIGYIVDQRESGQRVVAINASWGGPDYVSALQAAVNEANNAGILLVAAAGNESSDNDSAPSYPANLPLENVISVAAIAADGSLAGFSNFGDSSVDIAAPGDAIASTYLGNGYAYLSGTSMAAPQVTGALALLASYRSSLSASNLRDTLFEQAVSLNSLSGKVVNQRFLNVRRMLEAHSGGGGTTPTPTPTAQPTTQPSPNPTATLLPPSNGGSGGEGIGAPVPTLQPMPSYTPKPKKKKKKKKGKKRR